MIINMDETCWRLYEGPRKVLAEKGAENVKLKYEVSEKTAVTAIGTIRSNGDKLPMWVITKGKTARSLTKLGEHENAILKFSESGWSTSSVMMDYLRWLSQMVGGMPVL